MHRVHLNICYALIIYIYTYCSQHYFALYVLDIVPDDGPRTTLEISELNSIHGHELLVHLHAPDIGIDGYVIRFGIRVRAVRTQTEHASDPLNKACISISEASIRTGGGALVQPLRYVRVLTEHGPDSTFTPVLITSSGGFADERIINPNSPSPQPPSRGQGDIDAATPIKKEPEDSPPSSNGSTPANSSSSALSSNESNGDISSSSEERPDKRPRTIRLPPSAPPLFDDDVPPPKRARISTKAEPVSVKTAEPPAKPPAQEESSVNISVVPKPEPPKQTCVVKPRPRFRPPIRNPNSSISEALFIQITESLQRSHEAYVEASINDSGSSDPSWAQLDEAGLITPGQSPPSPTASPVPIASDPTSPLDLGSDEDSPLSLNSLRRSSVDPALLECYRARVAREENERRNNWLWSGIQNQPHAQPFAEPSADRPRSVERPPARNRAGPPRGWRESFQKTPEQLRYIARQRGGRRAVTPDYEDSQEPCTSSQAIRRDELEAQYLQVAETTFAPPPGFLTPNPTPPATAESRPSSPLVVLESPPSGDPPQSPE